jgi:hypothetical protein
MTLRLANWNVNRPVAPARVTAVTAAIRPVCADILVLTETHDGLWPDHAYSLGSAPGRDGMHGAAHRWVSVHSRFPLERLVTSDPCRTVAAKIQLETGSLIVFGTVLPWKGSTWRDAGTRDAFGAALAVQLDDVRRLRAAHQGAAVFMIGDFNQDLSGTGYAGTVKNGKLLGERLADAGLVAVTADGSDPVRRDSSPYACIDHICIPADGSWTAVRTARWPDTPAPPAGLSDHFGIVADLAHLPPQRPGKRPADTGIN